MEVVAPFEQSFAHSIYKQKYAHEGEEWPDTAKRVSHHVLDAVGLSGTDEYHRIKSLINNRQFIPGGRYLYASGRGLHQTQNCLLLRADDTREGWADLTQRSTMALMTGAGIGVEYSYIRESGSVISRTGGIASGPISLMKMINEIGRNVMQGGARRSAIWAGLYWWHPDIFEFISAKDWSPEVRELREKDFTFPADLDMTNISVSLDKAFFDAYSGDFETIVRQRQDDFWAINDPQDESIVCPDYWSAPDGRTWQEWAHAVYAATLNKMLTTAEPGFSVNYENRHESLRNACTEITSEDDSDVCNLGSLNMARYDSIDQFKAATRDATLFLLVGTVYSDLPYEKVHETREKNRRLGLGLMGIHEWLLKRGKRYGPDAELGEWLQAWADASDSAAIEWADRLGLSRPIKVRAIAPNGTIGIVAETTTSAEPMFAAAYKRRVRNASSDGDSIEFEYVVDPVAARLVENGVDPEIIEDAYLLSYDVERRVEMQAWLQQYVDHGISSTVNLPAQIFDRNDQAEFGEMLMQYLPSLRGITAYPDGSRGGQPLTAVPLEYALGKTGVRYKEEIDECTNGLCGV